MTHPIYSPRKLIEVALPLDAINAACEKEKNPFLKGHPRAIHIWWARRPLAAARAVIFAQMVNDPGYQQGGGFKYGKNKKDAAIERKRLFKIIEDLVLWENTTKEAVLERARAEIQRSWEEVCVLNKDHPQACELFNPARLPGLHDPFAGGGAIPLEAQRLGLDAYASDLNPVAVLINKAMVEIPPKFAGRRPVSLMHNRQRAKHGELELDRNWHGTTGLAEDVRYYGGWIRDEAEKRIGHLYPAIEITEEMATERTDLRTLVGKKLAIIGWLWARTVRSPNPAFSHVEVPLASTFILASKDGKEAYIEPVVSHDTYHFNVKVGEVPPEARCGTKAGGSGSPFFCLLSKVPIDFAYLRKEAKAGRMGQRLMAIVAEGVRGKIYLSPSASQQAAATAEKPRWKPETLLPERALGFRVQEYGMVRWADLYSQRQLVALTTFCDLVSSAREKCLNDAVAAGLANGDGLASDGNGAIAYSEAVGTYLALATSRWSDLSNALCSWNNTNLNVRALFARQSIPMNWDFVELSPFSNVGPWFSAIESLVSALQSLSAGSRGFATQEDAARQEVSTHKVVSTDPPYYDNIGYADLSDFFYVWLRPTLKSVFPSLLSTVAVPKVEELVATPYRHGNRPKAELFFLNGMKAAMKKLAQTAHPAFPVTIYYAFKQAETKQNDTASTGWDTFLEAVLQAGFVLTGTWPMRTEREARAVSLGTNSLASSIVLVCRKRPEDAAVISRREFIRELNRVLPEALDEMTKGAGDDRSPVAPVDLSQAIIGPGMAVFSQYAAVLEADGSPMRVRTALQLINRYLAEDDFDADTQFCLHWFEQHGWMESVFGEADVLARSKSTSVDAMKEAGVLRSGGGKVRLLKWAEYPADWDPRTDTRTPVWEALHQLIRALKQGGEAASGAVLAGLGGKAEAVRQLAYRLYTLCERLGQAEDARAYNELITSWTGIEAVASTSASTTPSQLNLFGEPS